MIIPRPHKAFVMRASSTDVSRFEQSATKHLNKMDTRIAFDLRLVLKPSVFLRIFILLTALFTEGLLHVSYFCDIKGLVKVMEVNYNFILGD